VAKKVEIKVKGVKGSVKIDPKVAKALERQIRQNESAATTATGR